MLNLQAKNLTVLFGVIISLSTIIGTSFALDKRWALAKDLKKLERRLDYKICIDRHNSVQQRIWSLEDRYQEINSMPRLTKEEYRRLTLELKESNCDKRAQKS
jgi:hypothetical protein